VDIGPPWTRNARLTCRCSRPLPRAGFSASVANYGAMPVLWKRAHVQVRHQVGNRGRVRMFKQEARGSRDGAGLISALAVG
jgi:hypothetical protein